MSENKTKVVVFQAGSLDNNWPNENFEKFSLWTVDVLLSIPIEYRDKTIIEITGDEFGRELEVYYYRPETVEEKAHREDKLKLQRRAEIERARAILARHGVPEWDKNFEESLKELPK